jgi:prepilin-type N-terminal cleavage/methylation domain-containing protein
MTRRRGLSLTEVLVALFIMALGAIAILTMFPLGALQMGQALKDDRTAQAAGQADGYMRWYWKHYIIDGAGSGINEPFVQAMQDPNSNVSPITNQQPYPSSPLIPLLTTPGPDPVNPTWIRPDAESGPSYPVAVDPMGWFARSGKQDQWWVGLDGSLVPAFFGKLARRSFSPNPTPLRSPPYPLNQPPLPSVMLSPAQAQRTCSLLDGLTYAPDGTAADANGQSTAVSGNPPQRELRYNWLWVLQRVHNNDPNTATMTIVVFDKRAHLYVPQPPSHPERVYAAVAGTTSVGSTSVQFPTALPVLKGGWIADVSTTTFTYQDPQPPNPMGQPTPPIPRTIPAVRNCNFYRVVSITDDTPAGGTFKVELQVPLKADSKTLWTPPATFGQFPVTLNPNLDYPPPPVQSVPVLSVPGPENQTYGSGSRTFLVLTGVSEVFERANLNQDTAP